MSGYPPVSTGYDAHAGVRHGQAMAAAAFAAVNTSIPSDEEMIEDTPGMSGPPPNGGGVVRYGKSSGKGLPINRYGLDMSSAPELYRHNPLESVARRQSPDAYVTWSYDIPQPISYHPHNTPAVGRGDNTLQNQSRMDTDMTVPVSPVSGRTRTHIGDSPPRQETDSEKD